MKNMEFNKIALLDSDTLIYFSCFNKKDSLVDKTLIECKSHVDDMINNIMKFTKATHYLLFLTVGRNYRYDIYPEYKANRVGSEKPKFFDEVKEYLITQYKALYQVGLEADDLCCIYKKRLSNSFIASADKDLLNLEGNCFDYKNFKWIKTSKDEANLYFWTSMITGDRVDNIVGLKGKGEKFAEKLFLNIEDDEESLRNTVLNEYINHFNEYNGVQEFYKNYMCLKMKEEYEGLNFIEPIEFNRNNECIDYELIE